MVGSSICTGAMQEGAPKAAECRGEWLSGQSLRPESSKEARSVDGKILQEMLDVIHEKKGA